MTEYTPAEQVTRDILLAAFAQEGLTVPVSTELTPPSKAAISCRITRVGGIFTELIETTLIAVEVWASRASQASQPMYVARRAMVKAGRRSTIASSIVEVAGASWLFDSERDQGRYAFTIQLTLPTKGNPS